MVRVGPRAVIVWVKNFRKKGIDGLKDQYKKGPPPRLTNDKYDDFRHSVLELQDKRNGGRIRGKDILRLIKTRYNIRYSLSSVYNVLKRANLVWITGRSKHPKGDEKEQSAFKKTF